MKTKIENGREYICLTKNTKYWKNRKQWVLLYTLSDGQKITVEELSKVLGCGYQCACSRLRRSLDVKTVFAPLYKRTKQPKVIREHLFNPHTWYTDPLVKLMLK